jgi:hypothetical protein
MNIYILVRLGPGGLLVATVLCTVIAFDDGEAGFVRLGVPFNFLIFIFFMLYL